MIGPGDDIIKEINSGATDRVLQKKYSLSGDEVKAFRNLHYALSSDKMTKDEIPDYYPELKNYFSAPAAAHESAAPPTEQSQPISAAAAGIPAGDYTKPVTQKSVAESSGITAPAERRNDFLQEQQRQRRVHEKYDPIVKGAFGEINSDKKRFLTGSRPALEDHPDMPASMYQHLNMPEVDRYLKESISNPEDRYYVRNQLKNQFEAGKDQYHTDEIAQQKIMQLPAFQQAEQQVKKELGDKLLGVSKDAYLKQVVQKAAQIDPALQEQVNKVYGQAQQDQQIAKNEAIRNEMNNTWAGKSLAAKMPFHDQVTGAAKALQGFFKYSGQVGQMASDLLDIIPSKATKEAAYSLRNNAEGFIEQNKFPEGAQTLPEFAGGELLPMMAQGAAFGKIAHFAGAPIYKALAGAKAAGTIGKFAEGAIGGMATAPINSYIISHDYYNSLVKNGETPEIAQAKAEEVFNKNLVTDMAISPLQFGIMNLPIKNAAGLLLKPSLSAATGGVHMMLQDYYQQQQNNPALHLMDYMVSPEGLRTGFIGAGVGLMQHYVIGKMNNWKADNWAKNAFAFGRKYGARDDKQLPGNHAIAATALSAMEMKDTPSRAAELHDLVDELHQRGVYDGPQAQRIKDIINDVAAVKDNPLLKTGTPAQRMATFNELLQRKAYDDASKDNDTVGKYLKPAIENSDIRIARILNNDEPLYFINGYETGKEQLLKAVRDNPELLNQNIGIKVVNDPATKQEILSLKNTHNGQTETKADAETQERGLGQQGAAGEHITNEEKSAAPSHENIRQVIDTAIKDKKIEGMLAESAQRDPAAFLKMIADQAHGITDTGHQAAGENAEAATRAQVGDDIVDLAKKLYPSPQTENNAETTTGERGPLPATEEQTGAQTGDTQPGSPGGSDRPEEIRQDEVPVPGSPRQEINEPVKTEENAEHPTKSNELQKGASTQHGVDRETKTNYSSADTKERAETSFAWLKAIERNDRKAQDKAEEELLRQTLPERQVLAGNDSGGKEIRASGNYGDEAGPKTKQGGTRASQKSEQLGQQPGESGSVNAAGTYTTPRKGAIPESKRSASKLSEDEKGAVVEETQKLSGMRHNEDKASSIRALRDMLRQSVSDEEKTNEIIDLITENLSDSAISKYKTEKLFVPDTSGHGEAVGGRDAGEGTGDKKTTAAGPSKEEVTPERKSQREYAYKNSYPEFKKKYPEVSTDEYNQLRSEQRKALIQKVSEPTPAQTEAYSTGIGVKPNTMTGRVPVDPIVGQSPKELKKIIADVSGALKQRTFFIKSGRRNAAGSYNSSSTAIKITFNGDLDTNAHELGHSLDDKFGIYNAAAGNPAALHEMSQFAEHGGSTPPSGHKNPIKYTLQEGIAEWVRAYIANPKAAMALAPEMYKLYQEKVSAQWKKGIETFSNDFRTWAGSVGRDQTLSNVEFVPNKKPNALQELFKKEEANNEFGINWTDKLAANYINPLHAFEKAFRYAKGIKDITDVLPQNDPIILSRVLRGIDAKFGDILETGMIDARMNLLKDADGNNKNLQWLLDPLDNTDQASIERDMKDTIAYMVAERTGELALRFGRDEILTGIGGGIFSDVDVAVKTLNEFKTGDPYRLQRIEKAAVRYREFADGTLQYMVDKGRLSNEQYQQIKDDNLYYVGLQRVLETAPDQEIIVFSGPGGNLGAKGEPLHKIKGSTKAISNPYVSLLDTLYKTMKESDRNEVMQAFRDMIDEPRSMSEGQPLRYADIGIKVPDGTDMSIPIFVNGKKENWLFQQDIYKALKGLDHDGFQLPWYLTAHARLLRFTTTHFPTFAYRNWIKDTQDRLIKSNEGGWTGMVTGQGFRDLVGPSEDWQAVARAGGLNSGKYFKDRTYYYGLLKEAMTGMAKDKRFILADPTRLKEVWHKYEDLLYKSETSNRVAEYRSAMREGKKKGMDDYNAMLYAGYKARDLVDFAVAGHHMRIINQIVPFSNAAVQGIRSTVLRAQENPLQFAARMSIYSILPGMAAWWLNHRDEDAGKEYEELPPYQRDMFWNFKIGDNKWLSMPKPYELSVASAGIDRLMSQQLTDNQHAFEGYAGDAAKSLLPFDAGNLSGPGQPFVEGIANYDFFRDTYTIPPDEDALKLSLRHTEAGSRLGQLIQQAAGIDARKVDHFIESQFSYMGRFAVKVSDIGKKSSRHAFDLTDTGLGRRSPAYNAPSVQRLLTYAKANGLLNNKQFKQFKAHAAAYFSAGTDKEKQQLGNELIDHAKYLLDAWEETGKAEEKQQKVDAKKAASE